MATTPVCTIDESGIYRPDFPTVLAFFQALYRSIYGDDVYLGNDSQDGQWLALIATAFHDQNGTTVATYNAQSPSSAQGAGLSRVVKINGIARKRATYSTVDVKVVGRAGFEIVDGVVSDENGDRWQLPSSVLILFGGEITVTASAETIGAVTAPAGTITTIETPQPGWQSVTNPSDAVPGLPVETDAALKRRQAISTALASQTLLDGLQGSLAALDGVSRLRVYENDEDYRSDEGIPGHCIAAVVEGGDAAAVAEVIRRKKGPGVATLGTTFQTTSGFTGLPKKIAFFRPTIVPVSYAITLKNLGGYTLGIEGQLKGALADWTNGLGIGNEDYLDEAFAVAKLPNLPARRTFRITSFLAARDGGTPTADDVLIRFYEAPSCAVGDIHVTVAP